MKLEQRVYVAVVRETSLVGQTARELVKHRFTYGKEPWSHPGSTDTNYAAVTLAFEDGSYITKIGVAGGSQTPFDHSEARALGNCIIKAAEIKKEGFKELPIVEGQNIPYAEYYSKFSEWEKAFPRSSLKRIVIVSDRSPCKPSEGGKPSVNCEKFFRELEDRIKPIVIEIFYDVAYVPGNPGSLATDLHNAKPFVKTREEQFKEVSDRVIRARKELEEEIRRKLDFPEGGVNNKEDAAREIEAARERYILILQQLEAEIKERFFLTDISQQTGERILSDEQQKFTRLRAENIQALDSNLAAEKSGFDTFLDDDLGSSEDDVEDAPADIGRKRPVTGGKGKTVPKRSRIAPDDFSPQVSDELKASAVSVLGKYKDRQKQATPEPGDRMINWKADQEARDRKEAEELERSVAESKRIAEAQKRAEEKEGRHDQGSSSKLE